MKSFTTHHWITYLNKRKEEKKDFEHEEEEQEELCVASMDQPLFSCFLKSGSVSLHCV